MDTNDLLMQLQEENARLRERFDGHVETTRTVKITLEQQVLEHRTKYTQVTEQLELFQRETRAFLEARDEEWGRKVELLEAELQDALDKARLWDMHVQETSASSKVSQERAWQDLGGRGGTRGYHHFARQLRLWWGGRLDLFTVWCTAGAPRTASPA
jgi:hypothetical protein